MTILIMTGHIVRTKIGTTRTAMVIRTRDLTVDARMTVPMAAVLMKVASMVKRRMPALHLPASVTLIATMFMMNRMTTDTMTQDTWTNRTVIRIVLSNRAILQNAVVPHLLLILCEFLLPPPSRTTRFPLRRPGPLSDLLLPQNHLLEVPLPN